MQNDSQLDERKRYVEAFNSTMVKIWKEKIRLLDVWKTGALYHSVVGLSMSADEKFVDISLSQAFNAYGIYVDRGTGSNTPIGNGGDIGRSNPRRRKQWFSIKYFASVMNLQEFYADNLGRQFCHAVTNAFSKSVISDPSKF